jgi:hypothetical protein
MAKWEIEGWGAAQAQISNAFLFLCKGKNTTERWEIAEELVVVLRALARGDKPAPRTSPLDRDAHRQEAWAKSVANQLVGVAMRANERSMQDRPQDQDVMLREIARLALWHMPNAADEARNLAKALTIEQMKQAHPRDDQAPGV